MSDKERAPWQVELFTVTSRELKLAEALKIQLRESLGPRFLDLKAFGSRARGVSRPDSDFDLLVVVDRADPAIRRNVAHVAANVMLQETEPLLLNTLVVDSARLDFLRSRERRLAHELDRDGVAI